MRYRRNNHIILLVMLLLLTATGLTDDKSGEQINWQVISNGGTSGSSASYDLDATFGQIVIGEGSSATYDLYHGYWQVFGGGDTSCCVGLTGDVNMDGTVDIADLTAVIGYLFIPPNTPLDCPEEGNADGDGGIDISDLTAMIAFLFIPPNPPLAECQ